MSHQLRYGTCTLTTFPLQWRSMPRTKIVQLQVHVLEIGRHNQTLLFRIYEFTVQSQMAFQRIRVKAARVRQSPARVPDPVRTVHPRLARGERVHFA